MPIVIPQTFVIQEECAKAAWQHGYRITKGEHNGWGAFASTTAQGQLWLAAAGSQGPWFLALEHPGVIQELPIPTTSIDGPGLSRYHFSDLASLYAALPRIYQLSVSLPNVPLNTFLKRTASLSQRTEAERLVVQRIGQDIFRDSLMDYWEGRCPLTGITDPALLRASHIIPWSECSGNEQRLDIYNGLLLSALWDAAFDRALVTFDDNGFPVYSDQLSLEARKELRWSKPLLLTPMHLRNLQHHQQRLRRAIDLQQPISINTQN